MLGTKAEIDAWLEEATQICNEKNLAPSTTDRKLRTLAILFQELPSWAIEDIHSWLDTYQSSRTHQPLGPGGKNQYVITLMWFANHSQLIPALDPKWFDQLHRYSTTSPGKCIALEMLESILELTPTSTVDLAIRLIYHAAIRPHELLSIRAQDVEFHPTENVTSPSQSDCAWVHLSADNPATSCKKNKTGARTIVILEDQDRLKQCVQEVCDREGPTGRLFPFGDKYFSSTFSRMKVQYLHEHGTPFPGRLYDCRHSAITAFFQYNWPPQVIHAIVGWRPASKMPNVYVHIGQEQIQKAINESQWGLLLNLHTQNSPISFQCAPQGSYQDSQAKLTNFRPQKGVYSPSRSKNQVFPR